MTRELRAPRGALGFDFDGARFSHVGALRHVRGADGQLRRCSTIRGCSASPAPCTCLDVGGIPVPLAAGLESVLAGLRELHADDNTLLAAAAAVFDALYAAPAGPAMTRTLTVPAALPLPPSRAARHSTTSRAQIAANPPCRMKHPR